MAAMFLVLRFTLIFCNDIMVFVDSYLMNRQSDCFSVPSERLWSLFSFIISFIGRCTIVDRVSIRLNF